MEDGFKQIECNDGDIVGFDNNIYKIGIFRTAVATSSGSSLAYPCSVKVGKCNT
jgi:hypothetical protein